MFGTKYNKAQEVLLPEEERGNSQLPELWLLTRLAL